LLIRLVYAITSYQHPQLLETTNLIGTKFGEQSLSKKTIFGKQSNFN